MICVVIHKEIFRDPLSILFTYSDFMQKPIADFNKFKEATMIQHLGLGLYSARRPYTSLQLKIFFIVW